MAKKEDKYSAYCLVCNSKLHDVHIKDMKVCMNPNCENYQIFVSNWYNFED